MSSLLLVLITIGLLILANGFFAMSEMAVISSRRARLQRRADTGDVGARAALGLIKEPSRFLSTIQLWITLIAVLTGALGGARLADGLARLLERVNILAAASGSISMVVVVTGITYLSLVVGELVPKRLALSNAEGIASSVAPFMHRVAGLASVAVDVLSKSTEGVIRLLRIRPPADRTVTAEEVTIMIERATRGGAFEPVERDMVERVFRLADRAVTAVMTPHPDLVCLDMHEPSSATNGKLSASGHSQFPVIRGSRDDVLGILYTKDVLGELLAGTAVDLVSLTRPALFVPETTRAVDLLDRFREEHCAVALVLDEYGSLHGMVTAGDILEAIVGELPVPEETAGSDVIRRDDGSLLIDGALPIDELKALIEVEELPGEQDRQYDTVGGFVMAYLARVPRAGDTFEVQGVRFDIADMDRRRVDKVLVIPRTTGHA